MFQRRCRFTALATRAGAHAARAFMRAKRRRGSRATAIVLKATYVCRRMPPNPFTLSAQQALARHASARADALSPASGSAKMLPRSRCATLQRRRHVRPETPQKKRFQPRTATRHAVEIGFAASAAAPPRTTWRHGASADFHIVRLNARRNRRAPSPFRCRAFMLRDVLPMLHIAGRYAKAEEIGTPNQHGTQAQSNIQCR